MAGTARVFVWAARGNRTVDVRRLSGPDGGEFVPPPYLVAQASRERYDLGVRSDRDAAYELLLTHGTAEDITGWVNLDLLARSLDDLCLAPHVVGPWRRALRDLDLLPETPEEVTRPGSGDREAGHRPAGPRRVGGADSPEIARAGSAGTEPSGRADPGARDDRPGPALGEHDGTGNHRPTVPAA